MEVGEDEWPRRSAIEKTWRRVIAGELTRETVHDWAARWVEDADADGPRDVMVMSGLQYLHGLDMTANPAAPNIVSHGGSNPYVLSQIEMQARLEHWLTACSESEPLPQPRRA
ncbi:hypothetical protein AB0C34_09975 [Nocardia sp. NPDC049220]|uniref:hypothetical protein n=1 Tax=Nocardia sp. NPDC049220 TaxID=3155273 RepID=UPI0033CCCB31